MRGLSRTLRFIKEVNDGRGKNLKRELKGYEIMFMYCSFQMCEDYCIRLLHLASLATTGLYL